jgi:hypothetical protein
VPTVLVIRSYRFFLTLGDCYEPPHVHVQQDRRKAKFWLDPVALARAGRFKDHELRDIERLVTEHQDFLLGEWENLCGGAQ